MKIRVLIVLFLILLSSAGCLKKGGTSSAVPDAASGAPSVSGVSPSITTPGPSLNGGDGVSNGGGLAEKNLIFAFFGLAEKLQTCLQSTVCGLTPADHEVLHKITIALKLNVENIDGIVFKSEKANPGFFVLHGKPRSALTGTKPGDAIYINVDHLYRDDEAGVRRPITVIEATVLLVHELAHHQGIGSADDEMRRLDLMTQHLSSFLSRPRTTMAKRITDLRPARRHAGEVFFCEPSAQLGGLRGNDFQWLRVRYQTNDGVVRYFADIGKEPNRFGEYWSVPVRISGDEAFVEIRAAPQAQRSMVLGLTTNDRLIPSYDVRVRHRYRAFMREPVIAAWHCEIPPDILTADNPLWVLFLR